MSCWLRQTIIFDQQREIMNKSRLFFIFALVAVLAPSQAMAQTTFKIATVAPEGSYWMNTIRDGASQISERTSGRVKFKFYTSGIQGGDSQVRRKMRIGQLHGGVFTSGGLRAFEKNSELYGMPMLFNTAEEVNYVRERMDARLRGLMEEAGYVNFGFAGAGFAYLMSNRPISRRSDMKGLKVWIPEATRSRVRPPRHWESPRLPCP